MLNSTPTRVPCKTGQTGFHWSTFICIEVDGWVITRFQPNLPFATSIQYICVVYAYL